MLNNHVLYRHHYYFVINKLWLIGCDNLENFVPIFYLLLYVFECILSICQHINLYDSEMNNDRIKRNSNSSHIVIVKCDSNAMLLSSAPVIHWV